jgi:hypothetical protein
MVTSLADAGAGTLRAAIEQANLDAANDTIDFAPSATGAITLLGALPDLSASMNIVGPGSSALTIARSSATGTPDFGIFTIHSAADVGISGLTITGGNSANFRGGGIANEGTLTLADCIISANSANADGGGIYSGGTLTLTDCTISANSANASGGGIYSDHMLTLIECTVSNNSTGGFNSFGGGIFNDTYGVLSLADCTLRGNSAGDINGTGGGIFNFGAANLANCTLSGNSASSASEFGGGGIENSGTLTLADCTISANSASVGGGISSANAGNPVTIHTSIVAGNTAPTDPDASGAFVSQGHNLIGTTGGSSGWVATDLLDVAPLLGPLADNGGPTFTQALLPGSPAIDAGAPVPGVATDQRGVPRPQGASPDIGAFELATGPYVLLEPAVATEVVGTSHVVTATVLDPDLRPLAGVPVTFQVTAGPDAGATGTTEPADGLTGANGRVAFTYSNHGPGTDVLVATAAPTGGPVVKSLTATVRWTTLTVTNTNDTGVGSLRAAIAAADQHPGPETINFAPSVTGTITLETALPDLSTGINIVGPGVSAPTVARSSATGTPNFGVFTIDPGADVSISGLKITNGHGVSGAGINNSGTLTLSHCTISGNSTEGGVYITVGGGIANSGTLSLSDCTLSGNSAHAGGGIWSSGTVILANCTLTGNSDGGGIANSGLMTVTNSTVSDNGSSASGGIFNSGMMTVSNSTVSGNGGSIGGGISNSGTMTLTNTNVSGNGASSPIPVHTGGYGLGGGISNSGTMKLAGCTINDNSATLGAGVDNAGMLTLSGCTISDNSASYEGGVSGSGAGIANSGAASLTNCTLSGNAATSAGNSDASGGGVSNSGELALTDCTLSGNSADKGGGVVSSVIFPGTTPGMTATMSIFANPAGGNLVLEAGTRFLSLGHNLFTDKPSAPLNHTDLTDTSPLLGPLADNGGPTQTMALLPGSPAIGAGVAVPGVTTDQRGVPRPQGRAPDIGAFQSQLPPEVHQPPVVVQVQRHGVHYHPTTLVVTFSQPMDAASVQDLANYQLVLAGPDHHFGTRDDRAIRIKAVQYNTASETATIRPAHRLPLRREFQLTIVGTPPTGLKGISGLFLDGAGTGETGTNYVIVINDKLLVPPITGQPRRASSAAHRA